jgi:hypothetical protein
MRITKQFEAEITRWSMKKLRDALEANRVIGQSDSNWLPIIRQDARLRASAISREIRRRGGRVERDSKRTAYSHALKLHRAAQRARGYEARHEWREAIDAWTIAADEADEALRPKQAKSIRERIRLIALRRLGQERHERTGTYSERKPYRVNKTYEVWTPEDLEAGDTYEPGGFEYESKRMSLTELVRALDEIGAETSGRIEPVTRAVLAARRERIPYWAERASFYAMEPVTNYKTGEATNYAIHVRGSPNAMLRLQNVLASR